MVANVEFEIVKRIIKPEAGDLPPEIARFLLGMHLDESDHQRMAELNSKANRATLTVDEERELDAYLRVCNSLSILHAKARISLKAHNSAA